MKKEQSSWNKIRTFFNDIHLWMGIASGIILFIVCLSGTIYTFSSEITQITDSEKYTVNIPADQKLLPAENIMEKALVDTLTGYVVQSLLIPFDKSKVYQLNLNKAEEKSEKEGKQEHVDNKSIAHAHDHEKKGIQNKEQRGEKSKGEKAGPSGGKGRGTTFLVDPYSAEIKGTTQSTTSEFFMSVFRLHRWLLLDMEIGRPIVGVATIIFVFIILTGIVIWFPKKVKNWKQGLKIKTSGNWKRINHDLHSSFGFYSSFLLLIMSLTGLTWSFEWYKTGFTGVLGVNNSKGKEEPPQSILPTSFANYKKPLICDFLTTADEILPYDGDYKIGFPSDSTGTISISKSKLGFFASSASDKLTMDQYR